VCVGRCVCTVVISFMAVSRGTNTLHRDCEYVTGTPRNRLAFLGLLQSAYGADGGDDGPNDAPASNAGHGRKPPSAQPAAFSAEEMLDLLVLLCPDFPGVVVDEAFAASKATGAKLTWEAFFRTLRVLIYCCGRSNAVLRTSSALPMVLIRRWCPAQTSSSSPKDCSPWRRQQLPQHYLQRQTWRPRQKAAQAVALRRWRPSQQYRDAPFGAGSLTGGRVRRKSAAERRIESRRPRCRRPGAHWA